MNKKSIKKLGYSKMNNKFKIKPEFVIIRSKTRKSISTIMFYV